MAKQNSLPPVACPAEGCGALMMESSRGHVVCPMPAMHGGIFQLPEAQRREWLSRRRCAVREALIAALPEARRLIYRTIQDNGVGPGAFLCVIQGKGGLWIRRLLKDAEIHARWKGARRGFVRATHVEKRLVDDLGDLLKQPPPDEEAPDDATRDT